MKKIKCLVENICEEVEDAEKYAIEAMRTKAEDPDLSKVYAELARQELGHADTLHNQAVRIIRAHKASGAETPTSMQTIWDWEHEKIVAKTARIKLILEMKKKKKRERVKTCSLYPYKIL